MELTVVIAAGALAVSCIGLTMNYLQSYRVASKSELSDLRRRVESLEREIEECEREKMRLLERLFSKVES